MDKNSSRDYPTHEQMKEIWDAYETGKPGAIEEVLRKRRQEREAAKAENTKDTPEGK